MSEKLPKKKSGFLEHAERMALFEAALKDALGKSQKISEIMGLKNVSVQKVQYLSERELNRTYQMKASAMMYESADSREEPTFMPEEQKISDHILVTFVFEI